MKLQGFIKFLTPFVCRLELSDYQSPSNTVFSGLMNEINHPENSRQERDAEKHPSYDNESEK